MIYILLPAFNEEKGLPEVLNAIRQQFQAYSEPYHVIVVDDGSRDRTADVARSFQPKMPLELISFDQNRGVKEVFRNGLGFACQHSENPEQDVCVVLDSDNTQDPGLILEMRKLIMQGQDLIIASRFEKGGKMIGCPWLRQAFSYGVLAIMKIFAGVPGVKDYSTFYRMYRVTLLKKGFHAYGDKLLEGQGFSVAASLLLKLGNLTQRIKEIPFVLRYDLKEGTSGINFHKTIMGYLRLLWNYTRTGRFHRKEVQKLKPLEEAANG